MSTTDTDGEPIQANGSSRTYPPAWSTLALVVGVALAIASLAVQPKQPAEVLRLLPSEARGLVPNDVAGEPASEPGDVDSAAPGATTPGSKTTIPGSGGKSSDPGASSGNVGGKVADATSAECVANKNGGATDVGVSAGGIKLGATIVQSGAGASFLGEVRFALEAVKNKANAAGGICGRRLSLKLVDDGWSFQRGGDYLRSLVEGEKVFALAVVPSSEGLKNVSDAGYLKAKQVPVIGTDGMLFSQYTDPYIWPVASSTVSTMHIMVKQAFDAGAKSFGLVYESNYHFGIEGAFAFNAAVKRLTTHDVDGYSNPFEHAQCVQKFCGISSEADAYATEIQTFNSNCGNCDFVGLLLEPTTATKWIKGGASRGRRSGGVQPLFTQEFGAACGDPCDGLWLWTGFVPPLGDNLSNPAVATYVDDIKRASSSADFNNQFVLGGYVGMSLVVKALQTVGPNLTRAKVKAALDSMTFDSGLTSPLKWAPDNHFANTKMSAYSIQYKGGFNGWRNEQVTYDDPWVGQDGHA